MAAGGYDVAEGLFAGTLDILQQGLPPPPDANHRVVDERCQVRRGSLACFDASHCCKRSNQSPTHLQTPLERPRFLFSVRHQVLQCVWGEVANLMEGVTKVSFARCIVAQSETDLLMPASVVSEYNSRRSTLCS